MRHAVKNNNIAYGEVLILIVVIEAEGKQTSVYAWHCRSSY